jgi:putative serine protease PepD
VIAMTDTPHTPSTPDFTTPDFTSYAASTTALLDDAAASSPSSMSEQTTTSSTPRARRTLVLVAATGLVAGIVGGGVGAAAVALGDSSNATAASATGAASAQTVAANLPTGSVAKVAQDVLPSVVSIQFSSTAGSGEGSGVILSSGGLILTNNHVVEAAANGGSLTVTFNDGTTTSATIIGRDPSTDLAVIQAKGVSGLKAATLGSSADLQVGQSVVAIGSPLGLSGTVTEGIVSALNRPVLPSGESGSTGAVLNAIQTDAAVNPGNSGGALVDLAGQVVGINSAIASLGASSGGQSGSIGLGFAIPIDQAKQIADQIMNGGTVQHARLGVTVENATGSILGAQLGTVQSGSAAAKAGLQSGDVITAVGDERIDGADALVAAIRSRAPGDQVTLTYVRDGKTATTTVTLESDATTTG